MVTEWDNAKDDIKRRVSVRYAICKVLRWRKRAGNRFDCGLCHGGGIGPVSVREREWYCHHCHQGGDVIRLIELAHNWDFITALRFLAVEARVELPTAKKLSLEERQRLRRERAERQRHEEELDAACNSFEQSERALRVKVVGYLRLIDDLLHLPEPWTPEQWIFAAAISELRDEDLLPAYNLLAFGAVEQRVLYLAGDDDKRSAMRQSIRWAGGVMTDAGRFVELVMT
jgi:hypothetical protein